MFYFEILSQFYLQNVRYLLVGGLAVNLYGIPRTTQDIDIIVATDKENIHKLNRVLQDLGYHPRLPVNAEELASEEARRSWVDEKNLVAFSFVHGEESYRMVDVVIAHPLNFEQAYARRKVRKGEGIEIYLASEEDLIRMKEQSKREQDKQDIVMLKNVLKRDNE